MGPDLEINGKSDVVMNASNNKENGTDMKEMKDEHMKSVSHYEYHTSETEGSFDKQSGGMYSIMDMDVNVVDCTNSGDAGLFDAECQDVTENSSSFDGTISEVEDGDLLGDAEGTSEFRGDGTSAFSFDGFGDIFRIRKKKLTSHWMDFIRPLMWRCKWVELQIKKLQSQYTKYDRELAKYHCREQFESVDFKIEDSGAKSLPFSHKSLREKIMKRKKRERVEATVDVTSYMLHHNLFSYYENKRSIGDGVLMDDDLGKLDKKLHGNDKFGFSDEFFLFKFRDGDSSLEQILWKIGVIQSQLGMIKGRLDKVMSENSGMFSSTDELSLLVPCNALVSSAQNPASPPKNGDRTLVGSSYIASQLVSEYNMRDLVLPESVASSRGEASHHPDIIDSTDQLQIGGSYKNTGDEILIYNQRAKAELNDFEEAKVQPVAKVHCQKEKQGSSKPPAPVLEPDIPLDGNPTPKIRSLSKLTAPMKKRKRRRSKAGR